MLSDNKENMTKMVGDAEGLREVLKKLEQDECASLASCLLSRKTTKKNY